MAADASIYGLLRPQQAGPGPIDQYAGAMQIRNLIGQQETQGLQQQKLRQEIADAPAAQARAQDEASVKADKEFFTAMTPKMRDMLAGVRDDQSLAAYRDASMKFAGMFRSPQYREMLMAGAQQIPQQFNPDWWQSNMAAADKVSAQLAERAYPKAPTGHTVRPDGSLSPIDPEYLKGQEAIAAARRPQVNTTTNVLPPQKTFENEDKLRADYSANPVVKASSEMQSAFRMIEAAYQRPSAANDLAMATKYMKILDPTSVVRESEFALAVNATGLLDKVQNYASSVLEGKKLNPAQREDFYKSAKEINDAFQAERGKVDTQFSEMATGYGLNPKNVIPSLRSPKAEAPKPKPPAAPQPGDAPVRIRGDDGYNALPSGALFIGPDGQTRRKP
jgi:hypothetical protein